MHPLFLKELVRLWWWDHMAGHVPLLLDAKAEVLLNVLLTFPHMKRFSYQLY